MTIIQYLLRITFMQFVVFISRSLGISFGVFILSINPFVNKNKKKEKQSIFKTTLHDETHSFRINALEMTLQEFNNRLRLVSNIRVLRVMGTTSESQPFLSSCHIL